MRKRLIVLLVGLTFLLLGGSLAIRLIIPIHRINEDNIKRIKEGMSESEVEALLGAPPGDSSAGGRVVHYADGGTHPFMRMEGPGLKFFKMAKLHAVEWVGDVAAVKVWFDASQRVFKVVPGRVIGEYTFLDRLRRLLPW
jgi:SmpA / OmlA family